MATEAFEAARTFEDYGIAVGEIPTIYAHRDNPTELAVRTYSNLGLISDEGKAREEFGKDVMDLQAILPEWVTTQPHDIALPPKLGKQLGELTLEQLIERYDALTAQHDNQETSVWSDLWSQYTPVELNQGQTRPIEARAVLLGTDNAHNKPGLYFTDQDLIQQREDSLPQAQKEHDGEVTELSSVSPAEYIIRNAMQLERGKPLQDMQTFTRFPELDEKRFDRVSFVPRASSVGGQLRLCGSFGVAVGDGVRLSVGHKRGMSVTEYLY